jgi:hypothetical protein
VTLYEKAAILQEKGVILQEKAPFQQEVDAILYGRPMTL